MRNECLLLTTFPDIYFFYFYAMKDISTLLNIHKQNNTLPILPISPTFGHIPSVTLKEYSVNHRKPYYFFLLMREGITYQSVDFQQFEVTNNELLFILPHQIHQFPAAHQGTNYFKLGFDEHCLSLLPKQYAFLVNPLTTKKSGLLHLLLQELRLFSKVC